MLIGAQNVSRKTSNLIVAQNISFGPQRAYRGSLKFYGLKWLGRLQSLKNQARLRLGRMFELHGAEMLEIFITTKKMVWNFNDFEFLTYFYTFYIL